MGEAWTQTPVGGEPHRVPPHSCVKLAKQSRYQSLVIVEQLASNHSTIPFHAWLTLPHIQISGRPLVLREHALYLPFMYMHMLKHWKDGPILRSSLRGEGPDVWLGRGQCSTAVIVSDGCVTAAGLTGTPSCPQAVTRGSVTATFPEVPSS